MKFILLAIAFVFCLTSYAQNFPPLKLGEQAVFMHCINEKNPNKCTEITFKNLIESLITPKISEQIKNSTYKDAMPLSILFITDENGKVIPEDIDIVCDNSLLQASVRSQISRLPAFYPKREKLKDRRSAHMFNYTLLPETQSDNYYLVALTNEQSFTYDTYATFKSCKDKEDIKSFKCLHSYIITYIHKYFKAPPSDFPSQDSIYISFIVSVDGDVIVNDVNGGSQSLKDHLQKLLESLPKAEPATIRGIATAQGFTLPIKVNIQ